MLKLTEPQFTFEDALDSCMAGMAGYVPLLGKVQIAKQVLLAKEVDYLSAGSTGELHTIAPVDAAKNPDPIVVGQLTKSDLVKVYDDYFVPSEKPARKIYNALLNAAKGRCPFCGGIGTPRNLDHFLPKAHFPQFSVLPKNLVPACRDCNMDGKGHDFAITAEDQIIQPYLDKERFFQEQWIFAAYHEDPSGKPGTFSYRAEPPALWPEVDKSRARKHFHDFGLALRYATKAAEMLGTVLRQIKAMQNVGLSAQLIISTNLESGVDAAPFANHWQKGMYQALTVWLVANGAAPALEGVA
ncbi:HNH endonuclease [Zoogloea dura]|uniref:HNH endonuclease n=1 Tax=Zoogloea dura TaxID=2728840 RepID=A0A848GCV4_9RHOO|nr:HNH endonuclease signature motif containing protein [Zoogloea dura]NML29164.1 HNH endonuclease [Zoogloea dura]